MKNDAFKLNVIEVTQPIGKLYVAKISPADLLKLANVDRRQIEKGEMVNGIQRELRKDKVESIKRYLVSKDATFPNSIILNLPQSNLISTSPTEITFKNAPNTFSILDGQHRLEGFRENNVEDFELIVTIFIDLDLSQQADIFSTINSEQTKVDSSLNLHLELNSKVYTPKKMMVEIAESFNNFKDSPWFDMIKMLGNSSTGIISLSAFVNPLLELTYPENDYYLIRNALSSKDTSLKNFHYSTERYPFWPFYLNKDFQVVYKILYNYFSAMKMILASDWGNPDSILCKTTGYNAMMRLFKEYYKKGVKDKNLSYEYFFKELSELNILDGKINSSNFAASGASATQELYREMVRILSLKSGTENSRNK